MKQILHSIRNKPEHIKSRFVVLFAILATAIIVAIWIVTLQLLKTPDDTVKTEGPFKTFQQVFKSNLSTVKQETKIDKSPLEILKSNKQQSGLQPEPELEKTITTEDVSISSEAMTDDSGVTTVEY
jgi:hypothetical protein